MTVDLFHPTGWVGVTNSGLQEGDASRSADHHAYQAQRNIKQCASCHREEFCLTCHSTQRAAPKIAFNINPHPNNWVGSARCKAMVKRAGRMCQRCHIDDGFASDCFKFAR